MGDKCNFLFSCFFSPFLNQFPKKGETLVFSPIYLRNLSAQKLTMPMAQATAIVMIIASSVLISGVSAIGSASGSS